ncbi:MAG: nitroreductase [Armatimonadota bacterium]
MREWNVSGNPATMDPDEIEALRSAIIHRRSLGVARLSADAVPHHLIENVLEAADWAPSHGETEPWRFTVYTGDSRRLLGAAFARAYRIEAEADGTFKQTTFESQEQRAWGAPVWISLGMVPERRADGSLKMLLEDELMAAACAIQNLHLMASAQGLAGMWLSKGVMVHAEVAKFVGLTEPDSRLLGFFILGWPNVPWPVGERRPLTEKVRWADSDDAAKRQAGGKTEGS